MKRCPTCGERYEDVYTTCGDGTPLEIDSNNAPLPVRQSSSPDFKRVAPKPELKPKAPAPNAKKVAPTQKTGSVKPRSSALSRALTNLIICSVFISVVTYLGNQSLIRARKKQAAMQAMFAAREAQATIKTDAMRILESTDSETAITAQANLVDDMEKAAAHAPNTTKPILDALARWSRTMASTSAQLVQAQQLYNRGADLENVKTLAAFQMKRGFLNKACDTWDREANLELHTEDDLRREMTSSLVPSEAISRFFANNKVLIAFKAIQQHGLALQSYAQNIRELNGMIAANYDHLSSPQVATNLQRAMESCASATHDLNVAFTNSLAAVR